MIVSGLDLDIGVDDAGLRPKDGDPGGHQPIGGGRAERGVERHQFRNGVCAQHFDSVRRRSMPTTCSPAALRCAAMSVR